MRKATIFIVLASLLVLIAAPAYAQGIPKLPHAFYGSVTVNGGSASDGTEVSATVNIGDIIATQNPVTTVGGSYGIGSLYLLVQGYDIPDDATITFYVNGESTGQTASFVAGGGPTLKNLTVGIAAPAGGGPGPLPSRIETTLFGEEVSFRIGADGEILETIIATSEDGKLTITIPEGTMALDEDGDPLSSLEAAIDPSPPDPPEDASIIGLAYDFGPDGATFDPPITFTWSYDPDDIPEDVAEGDLVIAYYDEDAEEWVELEGVVDTVNNTITASVPHFTCFAIIARAAPPPVVAPAPPPEVAPAPPAPPAPPVAPPPPPPAPLPEVGPAINWFLIGGLIAGVVVVVLLVYFLWIRRRAY